jgi:hypothetical protein
MSSFAAFESKKAYNRLLQERELDKRTAELVASTLAAVARSQTTLNQRSALVSNIRCANLFALTNSSRMDAASDESA